MIFNTRVFLKSKKKIESDIGYYEEGHHGWGTKLDEFDSKQIPSMYIGLDFREMNHDKLRMFFTATDREKFEMAYWAQTIHSRKHGRVTFLFAIGIMIFLFLIILNNI
jgi:hypothetical protein